MKILLVTEHSADDRKSLAALRALAKSGAEVSVANIYPHRNNRALFTQRLESKVDSEWTQVVKIGNNPNVPGDVRRCEIEGGNVRCDYAPVFMDKKRIKGLLKAWGRRIPDRYLDLNLINRLDFRRHTSESAAYDLLRQNAPIGAVMFIMNEIEKSFQPYFYGANLWDGWGYNQYYSTLLRWDDRHCYGLINTLRREQGRYGAGGTPGHLWAATRRWLAANQRTGIYQQYNLSMN